MMNKEQILYSKNQTKMSLQQLFVLSHAKNIQNEKAYFKHCILFKVIDGVFYYFDYVLERKHNENNIDK